KGSALPPARAFPCRRMGLKGREAIGVNNDGNLQLVQAGKERPELRQIEILAPHIGADHHYWHLEFFQGSFSFRSRCFWILEGQGSGPEIARGLPTGGNRLG